MVSRSDNDAFRVKETVCLVPSPEIVSALASCKKGDGGEASAREVLSGSVVTLGYRYIQILLNSFACWESENLESGRRMIVIEHAQMPYVSKPDHEYPDETPFQGGAVRQSSACPIHQIWIGKAASSCFSGLLWLPYSTQVHTYFQQFSSLFFFVSSS